jgi:phosphate-selective porin OprO/OprP
VTHAQTRWHTALLAAAALVPLAPARAEPTMAELMQYIEQQEQRIRVLERKLEIQDEATRTSASSAPVVKAGPKGFSLQSADGGNVVKLRGTLHFDGRWFPDEAPPETADTWGLRRARPMVEGTLGGLYDFRFTPDFAGGRTVIQDAYVTARFRPWLNLTAGKFKVPVGLERLQSANDLRFIERGFPTNLLPNRDLGVSIGGTALDGVLSYSAGYFNGVIDGGSSEATGDIDTDTAGDLAARLFFNPFANSDSFALRGLAVGIAGTWVDTSGSATNTLLPTYRTSGQQTFFRYRGNTTALPAGATYADGARLRWTPQVYYSFGPLGLLGEYADVSQELSRASAAGLRSETVETSAWQVAAHWFLTGEEQSFRGFHPGSTFSPEIGTWGAFELVARYHELEVSDAAFAGGAASFADPAASARRASAYGLGLNWYLNENLKWVLDYEHTRFEGGAPGGADRPDEQVIQTRMALGF